VLDPEYTADAVGQFSGLGSFGHYVSALAVAGAKVMVYTDAVLELWYSDVRGMALSQLSPVFSRAHASSEEKASDKLPEQKFLRKGDWTTSPTCGLLGCNSGDQQVRWQSQ
jgi:hypothetical protein